MSALPDEVDSGEHRVTPLELFFDLVFVFAITQVTRLIGDDPAWGGVLRGMLVLAALWWAWDVYAWLTSAANVDEGGVRLVMLAAMGAMFGAALAVRDAFGADALLFGIAYLLVRLLHVVLSAAISRGDQDRRSALTRFVPTSFVGPLLLIIAAFLGGAPRIAVWVVVLAIDYLGPAVIGMGRSGSALWWLYFDGAAIFVQRRLMEARGLERARLARDSYTCLYLPMVAGIVLFAAALETTVHHFGEPLNAMAAVVLCGGTALYLLAQIAFLFRSTHYLFRRRTIGAAVLLVLIPVATAIPALAGLALVSTVCAPMVAYEAIRHGVERVRVRRPESSP